MERIVDANGIKICCEGYGDPSDPAVILSAGATSSMALWRPEFCQALADGGRYVVRYDSRDTGRSQSFDYEKQPYTIADMAGDVVGLLDALEIPAAHQIGQSMGGMVAQEVAIRYPDRVLTLIPIMSSPSCAREGGWTRSDLPGLHPRLSNYPPIAFSNPPTQDEIFEAIMWTWRNIVGDMQPFDEDAYRAMTQDALARTSEPSTAGNHTLAMAASDDRTEALASVKAPTLVIQGTADPAVGPEHGKALADAVPGAKLLLLEGWGHEMIIGRAAEIILEAVLEHTAPAGS